MKHFVEARAGELRGDNVGESCSSCFDIVLR